MFDDIMIDFNPVIDIWNIEWILLIPIYFHSILGNQMNIHSCIENQKLIGS